MAPRRHNNRRVHLPATAKPHRTMMTTTTTRQAKRRVSLPKQRAVPLLEAKATPSDDQGDWDLLQPNDGQQQRPANDENKPTTTRTTSEFQQQQQQESSVLPTKPQQQPLKIASRSNSGDNDMFVPIFALVSIAGFVGLYAYELYLRSTRRTLLAILKGKKNNIKSS